MFLAQLAQKVVFENAKQATWQSVQNVDVLCLLRSLSWGQENSEYTENKNLTVNIRVGWNAELFLLNYKMLNQKKTLKTRSLDYDYCTLAEEQTEIKTKIEVLLSWDFIMKTQKEYAKTCYWWTIWTWLPCFLSTNYHMLLAPLAITRIFLTKTNFQKIFSPKKKVGCPRTDNFLKKKSRMTWNTSIRSACGFLNTRRLPFQFLDITACDWCQNHFLNQFYCKI